MPRQSRSTTTRPDWWSRIEPDLRNQIREWEAEIAAGTFTPDGKMLVASFDPDTKVLKINVAKKFLFPRDDQDSAATRYAPGLQIATLHCKENVPTSPLSVIEDTPEPSPEPTPEPSPTIPPGSSSSGMFVTPDESRRRRPRESQLPSEPPPSPTPIQRNRTHRPRPNHSLGSSRSNSQQFTSSRPVATSSRPRRPRRKPAGASLREILFLDPESDENEPSKKRRRTVYPVNQPRGKLYMDTRDLRKLDLEKVKEKEGVHVRPEEMTLPVRPEALQEVLSLGTPQETIDRLRDSAVDKHRNRIVNTTRGPPKKKCGWDKKTFKDNLKIKEDFGEDLD